MLPDRVLNTGPLTYESGALPIALHGPAHNYGQHCLLTLAYVMSNILTEQNNTVHLPRYKDG